MRLDSILTPVKAASPANTNFNTSWLATAATKEPATTPRTTGTATP